MEVQASHPTQPTAELMEKEKDPQTLISEAKKAKAELEGVFKMNKELLERMERFRAEEILRGKSEASIVVQPKEETPREYADRILRGKGRK